MDKDEISRTLMNLDWALGDLFEKLWPLVTHGGPHEFGKGSWKHEFSDETKALLTDMLEKRRALQESVIKLERHSRSADKL